MNAEPEHDSRAATGLGLTAVIFWSTSIGVSRSLVVRVGPMTAAASLLLVSGVLGCAWLALSAGGLRRLGRMPLRYLLGCGSLLVIYDILLYAALGLAENGTQVLVVGVINYLWPGLTLALSVPILKRRAGPLLLPGMAVAFAGVVLAMAGGSDVTWSGLCRTLGGNPAPYALVLAAAVIWALYSNLARTWGRGVGAGAVPLFLLAAGIVIGGLRFAFHEHSQWTLPAGGEVLFMALFPSLLAYTFWDVAVRHGNHTLVAAFSYMIPILSTGVTCVYLGVQPTWTLWAGCCLVVAGAVVCKLSIRAPAEPEPA